MNRHLFAALLVVMTALFSCQKNDAQVVEPKKVINVDATSIESLAYGGTYTVNLTVPEGTTWGAVQPAAGWISMTPTNGTPDDNKNGKYKLLVKIAANTDDTPRTDSICIYTTTDHFFLKVNQAALNREGSCDIAETRCDFPATDLTYRDIEVAPWEDVDMAIQNGDWLTIAGLPQGNTAAKGEKFTLSIAPDGPYTAERTATITFTGKKSGKTSTITLHHAAVEATDAFPVRWHYTDAEAQGCGWTTTRIAPANVGTGANRAYVSTVGVNNRTLNHSIATAYKKSIAVSGLYTGDYILFSIPSAKLAAGTGVDFMLAIASANNSAPRYWVCEILDGGKWVMPKDTDLKTSPDGEKYSFYTQYFSSYQHCAFTQSFTLANPANDGIVRVRLRVVGKTNGGNGTLSPQNTGEIFLPSHEFNFCAAATYPGIKATDVKKVAILGNSFTHYYGTAFMLKEIARSQGHQLDVRTHAKGSQYLNNHISLQRSLDVINETDYDFVILQEQSTRYADYAKTPSEAAVNECAALTAKFRQGSPSATIMLECTWPFPTSNWFNYGSSAAFLTNLLKGTKAVAQADPNVNRVSPIGVAFDKAYASGLTSLYHTDSKHPSRNGAYLKSCINYLMMFGTRFDSNVATCGCTPADAAQLRAIAEEVVLGHESEYTITH